MIVSYSKITPYIEQLAKISTERNGIKTEMYNEHQVKRGLRDLDGKGVITGLTEISSIISKKTLPDGTEIPCNGELRYRGIDINDITNGFLKEKRFGFEETVYLLLFSKLPDKNQLDDFKTALSEFRTLPESFVRDMILKAPGKDMMNILSRCVLALYTYDKCPDDISISNVLRQSLFLISVFPLLSVYSYCSYNHYHKGQNLYVKNPKAEFSTSENILHLLRENGEFSNLEARVLDLALVLHAEHGGGNNSTFTTHVVTSSGTDTYSSVAAALGSLKGPRHGGANIKVVKMFDDMKSSINTNSDSQIKDYLSKLLDKQAFDRSGLIYGMGHAVYSISDPRADILKECVKDLSVENEFEEDYELYRKVAKFAPEIIMEKRKIYKGVSANVDFYSGLVYKMLKLPYELYTPIFAISRIAGWSAHRIEEIQCAGKIIRPAYVNVKESANYTELAKR